MKEPRFAIIDDFDIIVFESDDLIELYEFYTLMGGKLAFRGIYDYAEFKYLDEVDIIDLIGVQIHSED